MRVPYRVSCLPHGVARSTPPLQDYCQHPRLTCRPAYDRCGEGQNNRWSRVWGKVTSLGGARYSCNPLQDHLAL